MNEQIGHTLFRMFTGRELVDTARDQTEAVATAIGCPEWTKPEGCDSRNRDPRKECYCATAARAVVLIERRAGRAE